MNPAVVGSEVRVYHKILRYAGTCDLLCYIGDELTPFDNDPFSLVWIAFKSLYPDKNCEIFWDQHQGDQHDEEYGFKNFPSDGSTPQVFVYAEHPVNTQTETFAHELAHVAVGPEHEHDDVWEAAFDAIFQEYIRIGDELFCKPEREE